MTWKRTSTILTLLITLGTAAPAAATTRAPAPSVVEALDRTAYPLRSVEPGGDTRDLRPLGRMIADA